MHLCSSPNRPLELLCLLSAWPAPARTLAADLGVTVHDLYEYARILRDRYGVEVVIERDFEQRCQTFSLDGSSYRRARQLAEIYWERRYGDGQDRD